MVSPCHGGSPKPKISVLKLHLLMILVTKTPLLLKWMDLGAPPFSETSIHLPLEFCWNDPTPLKVGLDEGCWDAEVCFLGE